MTVEKLKIYIIARKDAPIGKILPHVGHVSCQVMEWAHDRKVVRDWYLGNYQTKIVLAVQDEQELNNICKKLGEYFGYDNISSVIDVHDGHRYCIATFPITDKIAKDVGLKKLKLYS